jgi:hypothetical protein
MKLSNLAILLTAIACSSSSAEEVWPIKGSVDYVFSTISRNSCIVDQDVHINGEGPRKVKHVYGAYILTNKLSGKSIKVQIKRACEVSYPLDQIELTPVNQN